MALKTHTHTQYGSSQMRREMRVSPQNIWFHKWAYKTHTHQTSVPTIIKPNSLHSKPKLHFRFSGIPTLPTQKNSVPGIQLDQEIRNFRLNILYDNAIVPWQNNLLAPQLSFQFSITRISLDDTIILMSVRHLDKSRRYLFLTRYLFTSEDPHRTIHNLHFSTRNIRSLLYNPSYNEISLSFIWGF